MKFMHISDCHIGGWREQKISELGVLAFKQAVEQAIDKKADFMLISGDLFNSALPPIDKLKQTVIALKELKINSIACYIIPGSHDFSPSGKTMLDVLEHAGLLCNVCKGDVENNKLRLKFTVDKKTGAKITGMLGRKGMLDRKYYEELDRSIENEPGFKIFIFHAALSELKPKELEKMDSAPASLLPKNFNYYAGGHMHIIADKNIGGKSIFYPGALFPNNFREIEIFKHGGYYFYDDGKTTWNPIITKDAECLNFSCDSKTPAQVEKEILDTIKNIDADDKIVTLRIKGELASGKISDIKMNEIFGILYHKKAFFVMKSTSLVESKEFEMVQTTAHSIEEAEEKVIKENIQGDMKNEAELIRNLMKALSAEKQEGETRHDFEKRLLEETGKILD